MFDARATGLEIFDRNPATRRISALNLDKIEEYAKALNRLGLPNFQPATITDKLGTSTLNNIPAGKTLNTLIADST